MTSLHIFTDPEHGSRLQDGLCMTRTTQQLCDVSIIVGKDKIPAHRLILSMFSPYFAAMFSHEMKEFTDRIVKSEVSWISFTLGKQRSPKRMHLNF